MAEINRKRKNNKEQKHINKIFTGLSRDFGENFVYVFFSPIRNDPKQKKHINKFLAPTPVPGQSRKFVYVYVFFLSLNKSVDLNGHFARKALSATPGSAPGRLGTRLSSFFEWGWCLLRKPACRRSKESDAPDRSRNRSLGRLCKPFFSKFGRLIYLDRANGRGEFGSQTAADPPGDPGRTLKSRLRIM